MLHWRKSGYSVCVCSTQDLRRHQAVLGTAFFMLTLFVALYVLVYVECLAQRWLRVLALLTWACLMILGSVLMWDSLENEAYAWEQVMAGADVTGLGYQQPEHAIGTFRPLGAVGSWEWSKAACSRDPPYRLWRWISDGTKLSLFSEERPLKLFGILDRPCLVRDDRIPTQVGERHQWVGVPGRAK